MCSVPTACRFIITEDKILCTYVDGPSLTCCGGTFNGQLACARARKPEVDGGTISLCVFSEYIYNSGVYFCKRL